MENQQEPEKANAQIHKISEFKRGAKSRKQSRPVYTPKGITRISVEGFKSISREKSIEIRPLTILAGANSSGKSSIMQPLLLLKQTLEAPYDPGALLLNGPNVQFNSADQMLSRIPGQGNVRNFHVSIQVENDVLITLYFVRGKNTAFDIEQMTYEFDQETHRLHSNMSQEELKSLLPYVFTEALPGSKSSLVKEQRNAQFYRESSTHYAITRNRCFLIVASTFADDMFIPVPTLFDEINTALKQRIRQVIHLSGLRGSPERTYPVTAVSSTFPGNFESYFASVINRWQTEGNKNKLDTLNKDLTRLGLTSQVMAESINDVQIELRVNRFRQRTDIMRKDDMVNIADVGLGVSQTLPVLVALHVAHEGQMIYLEQPEIHLHPRAQSTLAEVLADAAMRGSNLVVETHSSLLLLGIQTLVAEGKLPPEMVKLHWFTQLEDGSTEVMSADLDENGAFGDWPEDFAMVALESESRYLDAQSRHSGL